MRTNTRSLFVLFLLIHVSFATEFHVAVTGDDGNDGSSARPFRTISTAARVARPGDVITVHGGTYRERVTPPRGGESDAVRIVYRAAPGEKVVIKGSEVIRNWSHVGGGVWRVSIPNSLFGNYNPYTDVIGTDWFDDRGRPHHTGEVFLNNKSLYEVVSLDAVRDPRPLPYTTDPEGSLYVWYTDVDEKTTTIYANFHHFDPNKELVEINVRDACFYPSEPGMHYITVRGFHMSQAATQWSTATDEQIGLIGTHWSKGWIIENNVISHSKNAGITLGKDRKSGHRAWAKEPDKPGAVVYVEVIERALEVSGWSRENVGSHIVRNNTIFDCEKNGIHGSLGAVFSRIEGNHIYNIWTKRQFSGADIAGIKFLGPIDVVIENNRIHNASRGMWMDWMTQGTRITGNLLYDNTSDDLFVEVNHGPFLVDNNLFLSALSLRDWSQGGAFAHNLMAGTIQTRPVANRSTPYHKAHSTALAGLFSIVGGDNRFYNNIFVGNGTPPGAGTEADANPLRQGGYGLWVYNHREYPLFTGGNVYLNGARAWFKEEGELDLADVDPKPQIVEEGGQVYLRWDLKADLSKAATKPVSTKLLGKAKVPGLPYENADGSPVMVDSDYFGQRRSSTAPGAGPFEDLGEGSQRLKVW